MGVIIDVNAVCTSKMVNNVTIMNERKEIFDFRKPLAAAVGLTKRANKRYSSSKVTQNCDLTCLI